MRRDQWLLVGAGVASVALWMIPELRLVLYPLTLFNTHVHELCHAIAALLTGGVPEHILVSADGSGVTPVRGGLMLVVASAGYVGSAVVGGAIIAFSRDEKSSRRVLGTLGWVLASSLVLLVRGDVVGFVWGVIWASLCILGAKFSRGDASVFVARFLGLQLGLTALQALAVLLNLSVSTEAMSDAKILQGQTLVPAIVWALGWATCAVVALGLGLRSAWRGREARPRKATKGA